jgi:hypothetical protein
MYGRLALLFVVMAFSALPASAQGPSITLAWDPPVSGGVAGYRVYVGTRSGVYSESYDVGNSTLFTYDNATAGRRYYFAVSAYAPGPLEGPRSSAVNTTARANTTPPAVRGVTRTAGSGTVRSNGRTTGSTATGGTVAQNSGPGVVLQPPLVSGSNVSLQWSPVGGLDVAEYSIEAGTASGLSNLYNASVGQFTSIRANVGDGAYFVRVRARLRDESTATSNEVSFSIGSGNSVLSAGCAAPPPAPPFVDGFVDGGVATVNWDDADGATSYLVQAGTSPGLSDIFHGDVGSSTSVSAPVPPGFTAYVRVVSVNACGQSVTSAEIFVQ